MSYAERMAKANISRYQDSRMHDLSDAYKSWSSAKASAWTHCMERCKELNGDCLKVISKNTNFFTAGFTFLDEEDGKRKFYYITANYEAVVDFYEEETK